MLYPQDGTAYDMLWQFTRHEYVDPTQMDSRVGGTDFDTCVATGEGSNSRVKAFNFDSPIKT